VSAFLSFDVLQNDLERLEVGVDVGYDRKLHLIILQFQTRESRPPLRSS
jgi:hypothetical protein